MLKFKRKFRRQKVKKDNDEINNDSSHFSYLINNFTTTFPNIIWKHASTYEVCKIIESFKPTNSCGYEEIPVKIVKLSAPFIIFPLTYICNISLSAGAFPERLKYALIRPVHKKEISISLTMTKTIFSISTGEIRDENSLNPKTNSGAIRTWQN